MTSPRPKVKPKSADAFTRLDPDMKYAETGAMTIPTASGASPADAPAVTPVAPAADAPATPAPAVEPKVVNEAITAAFPANPAPPPVAAIKTAPQPGKEAAAPENPFPWDDLAGVSETNLLYKIPPEIVAKMDWVCDNVPKMNKQRIVRDGVLAELNRLIALYYKP